MSLITSRTLSTTILKAIFVVACIPTFLVFSISVLFQYNQFSNDRAYVESDFLITKKAEIQREVSRVIELVEYRQSLIREEIESKLIDRIEQAYAIATSIYEENVGKKSEDEIKYLIVSALKSISYNEKRAYFYMNDVEGNVVLFMKTNKLDANVNLWDLKDVKGNYVIRNHVKIALGDDNEGFVINYFNKPDLNDGIEYPKLNYIKYFEPLNWYIGIGEYLDDVENQAKEEILKQIAAIRFGEDGYIFVNSMDEKALVYTGEKLSEPKDFTGDPNFQKQLNAIKVGADGFYFLKNKKIGVEGLFPKISYVNAYEKWGWIIGTGVYLDEFEKELARKEGILKNTILQQSILITVFMILIIVVIYFMSKKISAYIDINMNQLILSFRDASNNYKEINTKDLTYDEFVILADDLNKTLKSRNEVESKLKDYVELVNDNIIISSISVDGKVVDATQALVDISGYTLEELIGTDFGVILHDNQSELVISDMTRELQKGNVWQGEIQSKTKSGDTYWVDSIVYPKYENNKIVEYTAIQQNITDKKNVEYLSITDELTKLHNRRFFNSRFEEEINRAKRENHSISFIMLDLDYFKKYNDNYGHQAGDVALQQVSQVLLNRTKRASDFAFRLGGEEFGILTSSDKDDALQYAELIRTEIQKLGIENSGSEVEEVLTVSMGLVEKKGQDVSSAADYFKEADDALYKAKKDGRNRVHAITLT